MPDAATLAMFLGATLALNLSPGPDVFFVLANSARHGVRGGMFATFGISGGIIVHTLAATVGVAALVAAHRWAFDALRIAGACYLIWLGVQAWRRAGEGATARAGSDAWQIVSRGFITCVLNPKVGLFFLAFLPQFVEPRRGPVGAQILMLGAMFLISGTLVNAAYAAAGGWISTTLRRRPKWRQRMDRLAGSILFLLGLRLLIPVRVGAGRS